MGAIDKTKHKVMEYCREGFELNVSYPAAVKQAIKHGEFPARRDEFRRISRAVQGSKVLGVRARYSGVFLLQLGQRESGSGRRLHIPLQLGSVAPHLEQNRLGMVHHL